MATLDPTASRYVAEISWILFGRPPSPTDERDQMRDLQHVERRILLMRLLSSPEFRRIAAALKDGRVPYADPDAAERGLRSVGDDAAFVRRAYECLLGRPADEGGLRHYTGALAAGERRVHVLRSLMLSDEFDGYYRAVNPQGGVVPQDVQLCELANPAKWDNEEWLALLRGLGLSDDKLAMHRKPYEFTQLLFGCRRLGALRDDAVILSVGAGHEHPLYWLANHVRHVVATDMYEGVWQGHEGDPNVLSRPEDYAPFPYRRSHLTFLKMDGRQLAFGDRTFDVAYSLSSIEHFGGMAGAGATLREMTRVLKPGGLLALATEYVIAGPPHEETFQPAEFNELIAQPGLELVQPIDDTVYRRYQYAAIDLHQNPYQAPHMVVRLGDTVFTSVMVFLRKRT
jgi:SAM-dependent methyltransferase